MHYNDLNTNPEFGHLLKGLEPIASAQADIEIERGAPEDYIAFLTEVGCGSLGDGDFHLFGGLVPAEEIYGAVTEDARRISLFGSDAMGNGVGFLMPEGSVFDLDHESLEMSLVAPSFGDYIRILISEIATYPHNILIGGQ